MSRYMGLNAFGTDNFLRGTIRSRLMSLRRDDQLIDSEGVDSLSTSELQAACQSRGIRTSGVSPARLREELTTWIQLHLHNRVSGVLLVLGRAFYFDRKPGQDEDGKTAIIQSLESVLSGLPDNLVSEYLLRHFGECELRCVFVYSLTRPSWKSIQKRLATNRNSMFCNSSKNSLRTKRNKSKRKKMPVVQRERPTSWKPGLPNLYCLILRYATVLSSPNPEHDATK